MREPLYLKYRPKSFNELIGQDEITQTLINSIKHNRVFHSYLFYGPRGCGKTSTARILAKVLNCHNRKGVDPCNECISCIEITNSSSIDVLEIDAASHTQVQNIREVIIDSVYLSPARDRYKIYILDEVHMLSTSAFNALLKTIEEPPSHAVFILATTEISKVPLTIVSRCQTFRFKPINDEIIVKHLEEVCKKEGIEYDDKSLHLIASASSGAIRDALSLLEKISSFCNGRINLTQTRELLGYPKEEIIYQLARAILKRSVEEIHISFEEIKKEGYDVFGVLRELRDYFSKRFLAVSGLYQGSDILLDDIEAERFIYPRIARKINRIIEEIRYSDNPLLLAETFLYTLIDIIDLDELVKGLTTAQRMQPQPSNDNKSSVVEDLAKEKEIEPAKIWSKVLSYFLKENTLLYNTLLSVKFKVELDKFILIPQSTLEKEMLQNNIESIKMALSPYGLDVVIEDRKVEDKKKDEVLLKKELKENGELFFPEYERIKKVFGETIVRVVRDEVSSKTDR